MTLLHKGEEYSQSRKLETSEVFAFLLLGFFKALAVTLLVNVVVCVGGHFLGEPVTTMGMFITMGGCFSVSFAIHLLGDFDTLVDGLRSWRLIETFAPAESKTSQWRPPIPVIRRDEVQLLDMNDRPALPQPEDEPMLTPQRVLEILGASIENNGSFSRRTITGLRLSDGSHVTRGMWREMSAWLHHVGVLRQDQRGSYCLPHQISTIDDVIIQLQLGGLGGQRTGLDTSTAQPAQTAGREMGGLAERRRQRWLECDCSAEIYLRGGQ